MPGVNEKIVPVFEKTYSADGSKSLQAVLIWRFLPTGYGFWDALTREEFDDLTRDTTLLCPAIP